MDILAMSRYGQDARAASPNGPKPKVINVVGQHPHGSTDQIDPAIRPAWIASGHKTLVILIRERTNQQDQEAPQDPAVEPVARCIGGFTPPGGTGITEDLAG